MAPISSRNVRRADEARPSEGDQIYRQYYHDLRTSFPTSCTSTEPIRAALINNFPFPNGVVPRLVISDFLQMPRAYRAEHIANACANGAAIDSLVILLRLVLALGLDPKESAEPLLYDLACHDFGRNKVNDYIVKGRLLEQLYPREMLSPEESNRPTRVDPTLDELLRHPLVTAALWQDPNLQFFRRGTWIKTPGQDKFTPYKLDRDNPRDRQLLDLPFEHDSYGPPDLGKFFSRKLGLRNINGTTLALASRMPDVLPVILKGGHSIQHLRSFVVKGPTAYRRQKDNNKLVPVIKARYYHLRAILNLSESDVHLYNQDTTPVTEKVRPVADGDRPVEEFELKLKRGEHAKGWTFEDRPLQWFLLVYGKYTDPEGKPYQKPCELFGEYFPPQ